MPTIGCYTATDDEPPALRRADEALGGDLLVRTDSDVVPPETRDEALHELTACHLVLVWTSAAERTDPYRELVDRCYDACVPVVVVGTAAAYAAHDTTVPGAVRETARAYLEPDAGDADVASAVRYLLDRYTAAEPEYDDPDVAPARDVADAR